MIVFTSRNDQTLLIYVFFKLNHELRSCDKSCFSSFLVMLKKKSNQICGKALRWQVRRGTFCLTWSSDRTYFSKTSLNDGF